MFFLVHYLGEGGEKFWPLWRFDQELLLVLYIIYLGNFTVQLHLLFFPPFCPKKI